MSKKDRLSASARTAVERAIAPAIDRRTWLILAALMAAHAALFIGISVLKYRYYLYSDIDLGIFAQATDRLLTGLVYTSIRGMNWLGDHSSLILFPLAPLYAVFRHPVTLLVVQSAALSLGAIPAFLLARRVFGGDALALGASLLYLAYPAAGYTALFEFHPEVLATPALLAAFCFVWSDRAKWGLIFAGVALLAKEDVALVVLMLGLYGAWTHRRRWRLYAGSFTALAIASLVVSFAILKPMFGGEVDYWEMYAHWGENPGAALRAMVGDPVRTVSSLFGTANDAFDTAIKREYWLHLLAPLAFLPLAHPAAAVIALPVLAEHLLSQRVHQHTIVFQYTALITPFMVSAAILGIGTLARRLGAGSPAATQRVAGGLLAVALLASLLSNVAFGPVFGRGTWQTLENGQPNTPDGYDRALEPHRDAMVARVPEEQGVIVGFEFLARFANRDAVHSMHSQLSGLYTFSDKPYPIPTEIGAVLADFSDVRLRRYLNNQTSTRWRELLSHNPLRPAAAVGDLVLFLRDAPVAANLMQVGVIEPLPPSSIVYDSSLAFIASSIAATSTPGGTLNISTAWQRVAPTRRVYVTELSLVDGAGGIVYTRPRYLGYTFFPANEWRQHATVTESYDFVVPTDIAPGDYTLYMRVLYRTPTADVTAHPDDPLLIQNRLYNNLGTVTILDTQPSTTP